MSQEVFEFAKDITRTTQHSNCKKDTTCLTKKIYHLVVTIQCIFMSHKNHLVNPHLYYSFLFPGAWGYKVVSRNRSWKKSSYGAPKWIVPKQFFIVAHEYVGYFCTNPKTACCFTSRFGEMGLPAMRRLLALVGSFWNHQQLPWSNVQYISMYKIIWHLDTKQMIHQVSFAN